MYMRAGCLYLQIPISNFGKNARTLPKPCSYVVQSINCVLLSDTCIGLLKVIFGIYGWLLEERKIMCFNRYTHRVNSLCN